MLGSPHPKSAKERTTLITVLALFLFASPFTMWMASDSNPWFLPYLSWTLLILIGAWIRILAKHNDV